MADLTALQRGKTFLFLVGLVISKSLRGNLAILQDQFIISLMAAAEIRTFAKLMAALHILADLVTLERLSKDKSEDTIGLMIMKRPGIFIFQHNSGLLLIDLLSRINQER